MLNFTEKILYSTLGQRVFTSDDLTYLFPGSEASRHALVNKALNKGELVRLQRGIYVLHRQYLTQAMSQFYLASRLQMRSYVSLETALAFHGWIPEHVTTISAITATGRRKQVLNEYGEFVYHSFPINCYEFFTGVERLETRGQPFLMATPLRALLDLVCVRKLEKVDTAYLIENLRIEMEELQSISSEEIVALRPVTRTKRGCDFLTTLQKELHP